MNRASSPRRLRFVSALLLAYLAAAPDAAGQARRAPRFVGKAVPEPPTQGKPWTAPATKLPKFLVTATRLLFEQGLYDPRGCEYRTLEVGDGGIVKTHAFLLPDGGGTAVRLAICWDGLVRPAWSVGGPADLDADMKSLAAELKKTRESGARQSDGTIAWSFRVGDDDDHFVNIDDHAPIKLCLLLRLGRADLAEALFASGTTWTPRSGGRDLTDYKINYVTLAENWAESAFRLMINAHAGGEDAIALDLARRLTKFRAAVNIQADAMGFPRQVRPDRSERNGGDRFWFLRQLDDLLLDQERRASTPRGPVPKKGSDPKARIEALIRDLDLIAERPQLFGMASPARSARIDELVAEGDAAVEPLLKALEADDRLTRTVSTGRGLSIERTVHQVQEAEFAALSRILHTSEFDPLCQVFLKKTSADPAAKVEAARTIRTAWEKTRSVPLVERWYRTLLDDSAPPGRWSEVCAAIALPESKWGWPSSRTVGLPPRGEALRARRAPSVSDLMARRARQLMIQPFVGPPNQGFSGACEIASYLVAWDSKAALPLLREMTAACRERSDRYKAEGQHVHPWLSWALAQFVRDRVDLGDASALDDYAAWLKTTPPKVLQYNTEGALIPLYLHPEHPTIAAAARWMFTDPKSPWLPIEPEARGTEVPLGHNFFATPMIVAEGFREGAIAALADRSPYGTISMTPGASVEVKANRGLTWKTGASPAQREGLAPGASVSFRTCDYIAWQLSELQGCPQIELFWPEARRDGAIAACVAYLKRYGGHFANDVTRGWAFAPGHVTLSLKFPALDRPATREDVAAGRAIFSLEGEGEVRAVKLPDYPQPARWVMLKDKPVDVTYARTTRVEYDSDGYVWQAEEVRKGGRWERHYGFVGHHVVAKAPASEVEFACTFGGPFMLSSGLAATLGTVDAEATSYAPASPIPIALRVANRLGVPRAAPTEFVRPGADGKPALRKGITLKLYYTAEIASERNGFGSLPDEEVVIRRGARFDPGPASRSLAPLESFEAMRLDPADWFDVSRPGRYRLAVKFDRDSGVGEGYGTEVYFQVGGG